MTTVRRNIGKEIQPDGKLQISRIEIYQMVSPARGNVIQQFLGQITVGINQSNPVSKGYVL